MQKRATSGRQHRRDQALPGPPSRQTMDQDVVDDIGRVLGIARSPDEAFRPSGEILERRDRKRHELEE